MLLLIYNFLKVSLTIKIKKEQLKMVFLAGPIINFYIQFIKIKQQRKQLTVKKVWQVCA